MWHCRTLSLVFARKGQSKISHQHSTMAQVVTSMHDIDGRSPIQLGLPSLAVYTPTVDLQKSFEYTHCETSKAICEVTDGTIHNEVVFVGKPAVFQVRAKRTRLVRHKGNSNCHKYNMKKDYGLYSFK